MYTPFGRNTYQSCLYNVYCYDYNQTKQNVISNTFIYTHIFCILVNCIVHLFIDIIDMIVYDFFLFLCFYFILLCYIHLLVKILIRPVTIFIFLLYLIHIFSVYW